MTSDTDIDKNLTFLLEGERDDRAIAYQIAGGANGEASDGIVVVSVSYTHLTLPTKLEV